MNTPVNNGDKSSRRTFLKASSAAVIGAGLASTALAATKGVHVGGSDVLKIGLIGCGGRGKGAAIDALSADPNTRLTAIGDAFADSAAHGVKDLKNSQFADRIDLPPERTFVGFDAYKQVIDSGVDVVLLTSPPHFRAQHLNYAVAQGKHVFAEKPVAVDPAGVRAVLATCAEAKKKNLSVVSGLCYRYHKPKLAALQQIHDGAVGDIVTLHTTYNYGGLWHRGRQPSWSEMEYQVRNWLYFTWLSGDHICEQHVHSLDKMAWAMKDQTPLKVSSTGGRQQRTDAKYGNVYDHFCSVFTYPNGVKMFSFCRQQSGCDSDVSDYVMGTKGTAELMSAKITGEKPWKYSGPAGNMYRDEHIALFRSIRDAAPLNNGQFMAHSTMLAVMARMSAYTGKDVTWEEAMSSTLDLSPAKYEWGPVPSPSVSIPGVT